MCHIGAKVSSSITEGAFLGAAFCDYLFLVNILALRKDRLLGFHGCSVRMLDNSERRTDPSKGCQDWLSKSNLLSIVPLLFDNLSLILLNLSLPVVIVIGDRITRRGRRSRSHRWMHLVIPMTSVSLGLRLFKSYYLFEAMFWDGVLSAALNNVANKRVDAGEGLSEVVADLAVNFEVIVATMHLLWNELQQIGLASRGLTSVELQIFSSLSFFILQERTWPNSESSKTKVGASSQVYGQVTVTSE